MSPDRYTSDSPAIAPPLYLAVNVYRCKSGWMCSTAIKQAGGRSPRTFKRLTTYHVAPVGKTLYEAIQMAAEVLAALPAEEGHRAHIA